MSTKIYSALTRLLLLSTLFLGLPSAAQLERSESEVAYRPQLLSNLAALRDAALASQYAYRQVAHLTENIGPRMSGSPQTEFAVEYVAGELGKLGLEVHLEDVRVPRWIRWRGLPSWWSTQGRHREPPRKSC